MPRKLARRRTPRSNGGSGGRRGIGRRLLHRGHELRRDGLEEGGVGAVERLDLVPVDVDLPDRLTVLPDRYDDLRARFPEAGEVVRRRAHVIDHDRPVLARRLAADAALDRDARVLGGGWAVPAV